MRFRTNGPVLGDDEVYIVRPADDILFNLLGRGEHAYVVGPTQLGKTSLALRTLERLSREGHPQAPNGIRYAFLNLHGTGSSGDPAVWLGTVRKRVLEELGLLDGVPSGPSSWTPAEQWRHLLDVEIPARCKERVILCFDEIGHLLKLPDSI